VKLIAHPKKLNDMSNTIRITVPEPCRENWHNMTPKEQGRFCGSCKKIVVDFSTMNDREILDYFAKAAGRPTCGRFAIDQLNRKIEPATINRRLSPAYVWNLLLATALFFESCNSTTTGEPRILEKPVIQKVEEEPIIEKVAVTEDTARLIVASDITGKTWEVSVPAKEMHVLGFSVTVNDRLPGDVGLPIWVKQNCFDKEK
jgi:hypothetical protein